MKAAPSSRVLTTCISNRVLWAYGLVIALAVLPSSLFHFFATGFLSPGQGSYPFVVFSVAIALLIGCARPLYLVARRHPHPSRQLVEDFKRHQGTLLAIAIMLLAIPETLEAATRFKKVIPQIQPFYLDPFLVEFERNILGMDAWRYTHAFIGPSATRAIDLIYGLWHLVNISLLCWICLSPERRFQLQAALSYQLAWLLLGAAAATALSSVGPCFYEPFFGRDDFNPLMERLREIGGEGGLHSLTAMSYLLESANSDAIGGGISAMPSLHVAIATLTVLVVRERFPRMKWVTAIAFIYLMIIFVGSVHLGWHYALDGVAGAVGMILIWVSVKHALDSILPRASSEIPSPAEPRNASPVQIPN